MTYEECGAAVETTHGTIICDQPKDHKVKHEGLCDTCIDRDEYAVVSWDQGVTSLLKSPR